MNMVQVWSDGKDAALLGILDIDYEGIRNKSYIALPVMTVSKPLGMTPPFELLSSPLPKTHHISLKLETRSVAIDMTHIGSGNLEIYMRFNIPSYAEPFHRPHDDRRVLTWKVAVVDFAMYEDLFDLDVFSPDGEDAMRPHGYDSGHTPAFSGMKITKAIFDESSHVTEAIWKAASAAIASKVEKQPDWLGSTRMPSALDSPKVEERYHWGSYRPDAIKYVPATFKKDIT